VLALLVLFSFLPLFAVEATNGSKTILALMHVAVAVVLIPAFGRDEGAGGSGRARVLFSVQRG
jgi:hypothetical protein